MSNDGTALVAVLDHYGIHVHDDHSREQSTLCPLGHESNPSCSVNVAKGLWHCQSCGQGGDHLTLIVLKEGMSREPRPRAAAQQWAAETLGVVGEPADRRRRPGLSGESGSGRGGFRPSFRKRPGLSG